MSKKAVIAGAVLVCLLAVLIYAEKRSAQAVRPPTSATNLLAFLEARAEATSIRKFTHNAKVYVVVIGKPHVSPLSLPSGSPAYIFNETGALVDWCRDLGDNPSFVKKWGGFSNATTITFQQAKQLVRPE